MNANYRRVPTRFGPETRFEVRPTRPAPFRAREEAELERLKARLLAEQLEERGDAQLSTQLRRAADEAAAKKDSAAKMDSTVKKDTTVKAKPDTLVKPDTGQVRPATGRV